MTKLFKPTLISKKVTQFLQLRQQMLFIFHCLWVEVLVVWSSQN